MQVQRSRRASRKHARPWPAATRRKAPATDHQHPAPPRPNGEYFRQALSHAPIILFAVDRKGVFTLSEGKGLSALGLEAGEVVGHSAYEVYKGDPKIQENIKRALAGEDFEESVEVGGGPGAGRIFETRYMPIRNGSGEVTGMLGVASDVTARRQAETELLHVAYHDSLTGLPNRMLFEDRLEVALSQAARSKFMLALLCFDLDRFKNINATLGHSAGDKVLTTVASRLRKQISEGDTLARLGGDEYVLLLPQVPGAQFVAQLSERVLKSLHPPIKFRRQELHITTSIGIALYPSDGKNAQTLLKNADTALHRAKERGRNMYQFYASSMNVAAFERLLLENQLRRALERNEFAVHYQPMVDLSTGRIVGVEALARWEHPDLGLVFPIDFIPVAEQTGLIIPIGEWVLRTACAQVRKWHEAGWRDLRVSVNLSARQFQDVNVSELLSRTLKDTGLPASSLEVEITESTAMHRVQDTIVLLKELKKTGLRIAIDDFGTGYSSLEYLKDFPADALKLDKSFVADLVRDASDAAIAATVLSLTHNLGMKMVAEGVETKEQFEFLRAKGCELAQGYLFSRPLPASELQSLLARSRKKGLLPK
ncbi:MAG: EAL domain-containing protein [Nitrospirae bacterium]|nr:EAL domain-containing protein [Nitrospirota bacterium]